MVSFGFVWLTAVAVIVKSVDASKFVCYYNNQAYWRQGVGKMTYDNLNPALEHCDYLIYSFIGINADTFQAESLDPKLDLSTGKNNFKAVTDFKNTYPDMKVLLSIGGFADQNSPEKYLKVLENVVYRINFICSLMNIVTEYNFDGIDLAWQFPAVKDKESKIDVLPNIVWKAVKNYMIFFMKDQNPSEHRKYFTVLCEELNAALKGYNKTLTISVIPNCNYKVYYDLDAINEFIEQIHIMTYDYRIPEQVPDQADYFAPLTEISGRDSDHNAKATISYFLNSTIPAEKLIMVIPTFGRSWKMTMLQGRSHVPPITADGPGDGGLYTKMEGVLAYYEICTDLTTLTDTSSLPTNFLTIPENLNLTYGVYAYRLPTLLRSGIWVTYETPETATLKALYAKENGLGGVAVFDLTLDDFIGHCALKKDKFPIVRASRISYMGLKRNESRTVSL